MLLLASIDPGEGQPTVTELPLSPDHPDCQIRLRCLTGASAIDLELTDQNGARLRAEVPADSGETVLVHLSLRDEGRIAVSSPGRHVLTLALDADTRPVSPLRVPCQGAPFDLALVIDSTLRSVGEQDRSRLLLADQETWQAHIEQLLEFITALIEDSSGARFSVIAFGDEPPPQARAEDLLPRYRLFPEPPQHFRTLDLADLRAGLMAIPASSGGDFVDALADALNACIDLRWRPEARKLVIVSGDSPGFSILRPPPAGADACIREHDVDEEALRLHERGIELVTLHHLATRPETVPGSLETQLLELTAEQYRRLASRLELAWTLESFDPATAAAAIRGCVDPLGREATLGELVET